MNTQTIFLGALLTWLFLLVGCRQQAADPRLLGEWQVDNGWYRAVYEIVEEEGTLKCRVRYYHDGTSTYVWDAQQPRYLFERLQQPDPDTTIWVDAVSGATARSGGKQVEIALLPPDTLLVTLFVNGHPMPERWVRKKEPK